MKKLLICVPAFIIMMSGCAQPPRQLESVQLKASVVPADADAYRIAVDGIVYNESSSTVFVQYCADIIVLGKDGKPFLTIPSEKKDIFPFTTVQIHGESTVRKAEFSRLASEFGLNDPAVTKESRTAQEPGGTMIPETQVKLDNIRYTKKNIEALIQGGSK